MKKIIALLLLLTMLLTLCACKGNSDDPSPSTDDGENGIFIPDEDLVAAIRLYLKSLPVFYEVIPTSIEDKINMIKDGYQASYLEIDPSNYYFVGAYYEGEPYDEFGSFYNADKYSFIAFKNADDILEKYDGLSLQVSLQVNNASLYKDILTGEDVDCGAGHFEIFDTEFVDGINVSTPLIYTDQLLYLVDSALSDHYYASEWAFHIRYSERCVSIDGENYVRILVSRENIDGSVVYNLDLSGEFGKYDDALRDVLIIDSVTDDRGSTANYGLIPLDDLAEIINEQKES